VLVCRFRVTGDVPQALRSGPLILAGNHIGVFDPLALVAACQKRGLAPRMMATGGLFRAPVIGWVMRRSGHIRVDRRLPTVGSALPAATQALLAGSVIAAYPEGRITLDPGMWPERGKTGVARLALTTATPVVPVAQWGAHEVVAWDGLGAMAHTVLRAVWRRPVVRVHFGPPVDLTDLRPDVSGDAKRATDRILDAITEGVLALRAGEPRLPRFVDPTRPVSTARSRTEGPPGSTEPSHQAEPTTRPNHPAGQVFRRRRR
jgi:1-acyl-sn-glycerol-3-phosphate acyltransferase